MKISASDVRVGNLIEHQRKLWRVLKKEHVKPGKGGAFVQLELKERNSGTKLNERFRSDDKIEKARVDPRQMQYLSRPRTRAVHPKYFYFFLRFKMGDFASSFLGFRGPKIN